jgi:hypothetical protein
MMKLNDIKFNFLTIKILDLINIKHVLTSSSIENLNNIIEKFKKETNY